MTGNNCRITKEKMGLIKRKDYSLKNTFISILNGKFLRKNGWKIRGKNSGKFNATLGEKKMTEIFK